MSTSSSDQSAADSSELLTADDVIERLTGDPRLRESALACVLAAVKVGDQWRFRRLDLDRWIASQLSGRAAG